MKPTNVTDRATEMLRRTRSKRESKTFQAIVLQHGGNIGLLAQVFLERRLTSEDEEVVAREGGTLWLQNLSRAIFEQTINRANGQDGVLALLRDRAS